MAFSVFSPQTDLGLGRRGVGPGTSLGRATSDAWTAAARCQNRSEAEFGAASNEDSGVSSISGSAGFSVLWSTESAVVAAIQPATAAGAGFRFRFGPDPGMRWRGPTTCSVATPISASGPRRKADKAQAELSAASHLDLKKSLGRFESKIKYVRLFQTRKLINLDLS